MNDRQTKLYLRRWGAVRKVLRELGEFSPKQADAERHVIHIEALGFDKSSKDFTNKDLDKVLDKFEQRLVLFTGPLKSSREDTQPLKRTIYGIESHGFPDAYLNAITRDAFLVDDWRTLDLDRMRKFHLTVIGRSRAKKKAAAAARSDNEPF